jgi:putative PIN family toxin of toxin-antitoxin system
LRLVLDTAVMVAAIRSDAGASRRLLVGALRQQFSPLASVPLLIEYEAVMTRPEHLETAGLSVQDVNTILDAFATVAEPIKLAFLWRPMLNDADDDMVLEVAVNGRADWIVTFNTTDFAEAADRFGIEVLLPNEAVRRLEEGP